MKIENQIDLLNDLLTKCYDAEKGYKEAAENVSNPQLKQIFHNCADQRKDFGHQIKNEITKLSGVPEKGDSFAAATHRVWMDVKAAFATNDEKAILNEVVRGESYAIEAYEEAMEKLPATTSCYNVLSDQCSNIRASKARMEGLEILADADTK